MMRNTWSTWEKFLKNAGNMGCPLNPKKSLFAMKEGKLLGHTISKEEVLIDPKTASSI